MQVIQERKKQNSSDRISGYGEGGEKKPMHPDDFKAHLAWIAAKRFHEYNTRKPIAEKQGYYRFIGCRL